MTVLTVFAVVLGMMVLLGILIAAAYQKGYSDCQDEYGEVVSDEDYKRETHGN